MAEQKKQQPKIPATFAGGAGIGVSIAVYIGHQYGLDPELVTVIGSVLSALIGFGVHKLNKMYPHIINELEAATGLDIDGDGDVGK